MEPRACLYRMLLMHTLSFQGYSGHIASLRLEQCSRNSFSLHYSRYEARSDISVNIDGIANRDEELRARVVDKSNEKLPYVLAHSG